MMSATRARWLPVGVLLLGSLGLTTVRQQEVPALRGALSAALPGQVRGMSGADASISDAEAGVAGFTDYALRIYSPEAAPGEAALLGASIYLGYYSSQTRGRTIHSPKNCLPGAGWHVIDAQPLAVDTDGAESITVNQYVLQRGDERALVLYWYQGRGRVAHNEYLVKWDLLRDAALKRRTDEALVRIVVPVDGSEQEAVSLATEIARTLKPAVDAVLPA